MATPLSDSEPAQSRDEDTLDHPEAAGGDRDHGEDVGEPVGDEKIDRGDELPNAAMKTQSDAASSSQLAAAQPTALRRSSLVVDEGPHPRLRSAGCGGGPVAV